MFIYFAIFGLIVLITGIILRKKFKKKVWIILIGVGVLSVIISIVLFVCTLLLVYSQDDNVQISSTDSIDIDIIGRDCRTWRGYTEDYEIADYNSDENTDLLIH